MLSHRSINNVCLTVIFSLLNQVFESIKLHCNLPIEHFIRHSHKKTTCRDGTFSHHTLSKVNSSLFFSQPGTAFLILFNVIV